MFEKAKLENLKNVFNKVRKANLANTVPQSEEKILQDLLKKEYFKPIGSFSCDNFSYFFHRNPMDISIKKDTKNQSSPVWVVKIYLMSRRNYSRPEYQLGEIGTISFSNLDTDSDSPTVAYSNETVRALGEGKSLDDITLPKPLSTQIEVDGFKDAYQSIKTHIEYYDPQAFNDASKKTKQSDPVMELLDKILKNPKDDFVTSFKVNPLSVNPINVFGVVGFGVLLVGCLASIIVNALILNSFPIEPIVFHPHIFGVAAAVPGVIIALVGLAFSTVVSFTRTRSELLEELLEKAKQLSPEASQMIVDEFSKKSQPNATQVDSSKLAQESTASSPVISQPGDDPVVQVDHSGRVPQIFIDSLINNK